MAMPGIRTAVAEMCMFGLAACDEGRPRFVNASVRTITNARRVGERAQMTMTMTAKHTHKWRHHAVQITHCTNQLLVARPTRSQVCTDASMLCGGKADNARHGTRQEDRTIPHWEDEGKVLVWLAAEAYSGAGDATRPLGDLSRLGSSRERGGHCLQIWTKKQQVVSLTSAESELHAAVKTASEWLGIQSVAKDLGVSCRLNLHLDASATMCLVNRGGLGKAKHVDMQNLWIQEASNQAGLSRRK